MTSRIIVGVFAVVLSLAAPVDVDAQTFEIRRAFDSLESAVQSAQSDPTWQNFAAVRRAVNRVHSIPRGTAAYRNLCDSAWWRSASGESMAALLDSVGEFDPNRPCNSAGDTPLHIALRPVEFYTVETASAIATFVDNRDPDYQRRNRDNETPRSLLEIRNDRNATRVFIGLNAMCQNVTKETVDRFNNDSERSYIHEIRLYTVISSRMGGGTPIAEEQKVLRYLFGHPRGIQSVEQVCEHVREQGDVFRPIPNPRPAPTVAFADDREAMDSIRDAADALRDIHYNVFNGLTMGLGGVREPQGLYDAITAAIDQLLNSTDEFDQALQALVDETVEFTYALESGARALARAERQYADRRERTPEQEQEPRNAEAGNANRPGEDGEDTPEQEQESIVDQWIRSVQTAVQEAERQVAEVERRTCGYVWGTRAYNAIGTAYSRLRGNFRTSDGRDVFLPRIDRSSTEEWRDHLDELWERVSRHVQTTNVPCDGDPLPGR